MIEFDQYCYVGIVNGVVFDVLNRLINRRLLKTTVR